METKFWLRIDRWLSGNGFHRFIIPVVLAISAYLAVLVILILPILRDCSGLDNLKFAADSCRPIGDIWGDIALERVLTYNIFPNGKDNKGVVRNLADKSILDGLGSKVSVNFSAVDSYNHLITFGKGCADIVQRSIVLPCH